MIVLNYGIGTNSTALAIEAWMRGIQIDIAVCADTGSERPESYAYITIFDEWLRSHHGISLNVVRWIRRDGTFTPLHEDCESKRTLPSKAFGLAGCTAKWKQQPVDKWLLFNYEVHSEHIHERAVERWIGFDADEPERAERMLNKNPFPELWRWRAPLVEWNMGRDECVESIKRAGLPLPGKSACWLCPSSRPREIIELGKAHPELLDRALKIEAQAELGTVKGLGRSWSWKSVIENDRAQLKLPIMAMDACRIDTDCGCYDGD